MSADLNAGHCMNRCVARLTHLSSLLTPIWYSSFCISFIPKTYQGGACFWTMQFALHGSVDGTLFLLAYCSSGRSNETTSRLKYICERDNFRLTSGVNGSTRPASLFKKAPSLEVSWYAGFYVGASLHILVGRFIGFC